MKFYGQFSGMKNPFGGRLRSSSFAAGGWLLLAGLLLTLSACSTDEIAADLRVDLPTPTKTATPFPTKTAVPSPTAEPTAAPATPVPTATPLPPVFVEVSGPALVPAGLPRSVTWGITVTQGAELVIVSIDDLGGTMLTGSSGGELQLARSLMPLTTNNGGANFPGNWLIEGVIDPNVGQGLLSFFLETADHAEVVHLPWRVSPEGALVFQTKEVEIDGIDDAGQGMAESETSPAGRPGFLIYESAGGLSLEHPTSWYINESQDGVILLSPDPLASADGARPAGGPYATLVGGSRDIVGLPSDVAADADSIVDWLLGDMTTTGGENAGTFLADGLEVAGRESIELADGSRIVRVDLEKAAEDPADSFRAVFLVRALDEENIFILTAFEPPDQSISDDLETVLATLP